MGRKWPLLYSTILYSRYWQLNKAPNLSLPESCLIFKWPRVILQWVFVKKSENYACLAALFAIQQG